MDSISEPLLTQISGEASVLYRASLQDGFKLEAVSTMIGSFGYWPEKIIAEQKNWSELVHPEDYWAWEERLSILLRSKSDERAYRLLKADGSYVWIRDTACLITDEAGRPQDILGVWRDIDAEVKVQDQARLLWNVLDKTSIIASTDRRGQIVYVNDNFCLVSGYRREELLGANHRILNSGLHDAQFFRTLWTEIAAGRIWRGEICNKRKDGSLYWVDTTIAPVLGRGRSIAGFISVRQDITERKAGELAVAHASRMAALGEMAGGIAHEINNPMAIIRGSADRILKLVKGERVNLEAIAEFAVSIRQTTDRVVKIVTGLKRMSRAGGVSDFAEVDIGDLINEVIEICHARLTQRCVEVIQNYSQARGTTVYGSRTQLGQILINLINNADDAISSLDQKWIKIEAGRDSEKVHIAVEDSGLGIPVAVRQKLFTPFFTTKPIGKGTGLGLGISRKIAEQHGGFLYLDGTAERTRFVLQLPKKSA